MDNLKKQLGNKIKEYRKLKLYSQENFAEKAGIAKQTLSSIELGINFPTHTILTKIINALEVHPVELFAFDIENDEQFTLLLNAMVSRMNTQQREFLISMMHVISEKLK